MVYAPTAWKEKNMTTQQKVDGLNNIECIYDESITYMNALAHDIHTKVEADARFYKTPSHPSGRSDTGEGCGIDAAKLDGMTLAEILAAALPAGSIGMWGAGALPTGFHECDGLNSTPNLQGYMIKGAGNGVTPGSSGGSNSATPTAGSFTSPGCTLTDNQIPRHTHDYLDWTNTTINWQSAEGGGPRKNGEFRTIATTTTQPGAVSVRTAHSHANCSFTWSGYLNDQGVHQGVSTLDIRPACRAVKFIVKG